MTTLEEAKAFLQKEAPDGTNLYDHLAEVLLKILVERPENLHETFEHLSVAVRQKRYVPPPPPPSADGAPDLATTRPFVSISVRCSSQMHSLSALGH
jgi:radial spoke head protein 4A